MEQNKCGAYEIYLLSVLTWITWVIRWRSNLYGFCFNFFISLVLRSITWKDMCVCRCTAFKYQTPAVLGGRWTLWWGEHLGWFEAACSLGENAPVVSTFLHLSMELHPPLHLPQSAFASLVVAAPFYQGLGFILIRAEMHLQIFSHILWLEWLAFCCIPSLSPCCYTCSLSAFHFSLSAGSSVCQDHLIINLCPLFFSSCSIIAVEGDSWCLQTYKTPFLSLCGILWTAQ